MNPKNDILVDKRQQYEPNKDHAYKFMPMALQ